MFVAFWNQRTTTMMAGAANSPRGPIEGPLPNGMDVPNGGVYLNEADAYLNSHGWRRDGEWRPVTDGYSAAIVPA